MAKIGDITVDGGRRARERYGEGQALTEGGKCRAERKRNGVRARRDSQRGREEEIRKDSLRWKGWGGLER